jgi:hypothetical protein
VILKYGIKTTCKKIETHVFRQICQVCSAHFSMAENSYTIFEPAQSSKEEKKGTMLLLELKAQTVHGSIEKAPCKLQYGCG